MKRWLSALPACLLAAALSAALSACDDGPSDNSTPVTGAPLSIVESVPPDTSAPETSVPETTAPPETEPPLGNA